ncbi:recombinase family protein [Arthrobacter woluwensis]|uniref:recombinase family protein n=1 Tax=Arthrobacter woluwensis TaxID=156980 RepID=UPI0011A8D64B|nr:recombinase family protein [Arthrobacter woluwensis]
MEDQQYVQDAGLLKPKRAIAYIRVSTRGQAERDGRREGLSIPAQRQAIRRKAGELGVLVVKEFVDHGRTGTTMDRPELQRMLAYLREGQGVDFVIVHKLDRLARSRAGDVEASAVIATAGACLVSTAENIDETPAGMLLHGIMSSIAEFYSQNLSTEVLKGMRQKAELGGTLCRAPIGYLNRHILDSAGRERRDVIIDPERAPLIQEAFRLYVTGDWSLHELAQHLTRQGLCSRQTAHRESRPITRSSLQVILTNPYYCGFVRYEGKCFQGAHQRLVSPEMWNHVQTMLESRRNGERKRTHPHYLKSSLFCGGCGRRLLVQHSRGRSGTVYPYFTCRAPHGDCCQSAWSIPDVEHAVEAAYRAERLPLPLAKRSRTRARPLSGYYRQASPAARRLLNQALFDRILIDHHTG